MLRLWTVGGAGLVCLASVAAQAAPMGGVRDVLSLPHGASITQNVATRHCWQKNGKTRCAPARQARPQRSGGVAYGQPRPEDLPVGSTDWWRAMEREGRGGFAPDN
jgi:hypothetical protein